MYPAAMLGRSQKKKWGIICLKKQLGIELGMVSVTFEFFQTNTNWFDL
jgi:hypothetical protein